MRKRKALAVFAMVALLTLSATVPAGASTDGYIVVRNEAPYDIYEFQVWIYPGTNQYGFTSWCQYDRRDGSYDELWFSRDRGCWAAETPMVWVRVWRSRTSYEDHTFGFVPWNTKLILTGQGWKMTGL